MHFGLWKAVCTGVTIESGFRYRGTTRVGESEDFRDLIERFTNGLGSPGSRFDVWGSDEFKAKAPKLDNIAKVMVFPPAPDLLPWHHPANGRFAETEPILLNEFIKVTLGQVDSDKFADDTAKQIQAIMDKPGV